MEKYKYFYSRKNINKNNFDHYRRTSTNVIGTIWYTWWAWSAWIRVTRVYSL